MNIVLDCDEVILDTIPAFGAWYLKNNPGAEIFPDAYPSTWPAFAGPGGFAAFRNAMTAFALSPDFMRVDPLPLAAQSIYELKRAGDSLSVLSSISGAPGVGRARAAQLKRIVGARVLDNIVVQDMHLSKGDMLEKMNADVLVDDGLSNVQAAIEKGRAGIVFRCPQNAALLDGLADCGASENSIINHDRELIRSRAIVANGWPAVLSAIQSLRR